MIEQFWGEEHQRLLDRHLERLSGLAGERLVGLEHRHPTSGPIGPALRLLRGESGKLYHYEVGADGEILREVEESIGTRESE